MDAVEVRASNDGAGVEERDRFPLRDVAIALAEEARPLCTVPPSNISAKLVNFRNGGVTGRIFCAPSSGPTP
jgi:hypothetical protein